MSVHLDDMRRPCYDANMTTATPAAPAAPETVEFVFSPLPGISRAMLANVPNEGQLAVWSASAERLQSLGQEWAETRAALGERDEDDPDLAAFRQQQGEQASRALVRVLKIINTLLVRQADRDWIEDSLLEGRFKLGDAMGVLASALDAMKARRKAETSASGPAKKARRG